jgi:hypothetical protein
LIIAQLDRSYAIAFKDEPLFAQIFDNPHNEKQEFIFYDLLEFFVLISHTILSTQINLSIHEQGLSACFSYLIKTHILPLTQDSFVYNPPFCGDELAAYIIEVFRC